MLGRHHHIRRAPECVRACREYRQSVACGCSEADLSASAPANPVALLCLDAVNEINLVEAIEKLLRVIRDLEHPLAFHFVRCVRTAPLTFAVNHFLIREDNQAGGTPVD